MAWWYQSTTGFGLHRSAASAVGDIPRCYQPRGCVCDNRTEWTPDTYQRWRSTNLRCHYQSLNRVIHSCSPAPYDLCGQELQPRESGRTLVRKQELGDLVGMTGGVLAPQIDQDTREVAIEQQVAREIRVPALPDLE